MAANFRDIDVTYAQQAYVVPTAPGTPVGEFVVQLIEQLQLPPATDRMIYGLEFAGELLPPGADVCASIPAGGVAALVLSGTANSLPHDEAR